MASKNFDPVRRDIFKKGVAVTAGAIAAGLMFESQPARAAKASKAVAMYQDKPHGQQQCDGCVHFVPGATPTANGTCKVVEGSISPKGWCVLFAPKA